MVIGNTRFGVLIHIVNTNNIPEIGRRSPGVCAAVVSARCPRTRACCTRILSCSCLPRAMVLVVSKALLVLD